MSPPSWLLLLVALAALCVANGRWHLAPATWLAPTLLLLFVQSQPLRRGLTFAFLAQLLAFFVNWWGMIPVPGLWYYLVAGIYAAFYFFPFVLHRLVAQRMPGFLATLVFPSSWVAIELVLQNFVTPYGSWASLAYTQISFLPLMQLAAVTGISGIHFLISWSAAVAAWVWPRRTRFAEIRSGAIIWVVAVLTVLAWGQSRILLAPDDASLLRVAGLTPSAALNEQLQNELGSVVPAGTAGDVSFERALEFARRLNNDLLERTRAEAIAGADIVVWSEHAALVMPQTEPELIERARGLARTHDVHLILGIGLWDPEARPSFENKLIPIAANGEQLTAYFKARPIAGQESGLIEAGENAIATIETARGRFGAVICHDLDFPDLLRQAGQGEIVVMFGPSSDWEAITPFHARMAIPRAVENGCALVRPCSNGLSIVVDPLGRTLARQIDEGDDGNVLRAAVPLYRLRTIYPAIGDAFAYGNVVAMLLLLAIGLARRQRHSRMSEGD